jgi:hypothetical protein
MKTLSRLFFLTLAAMAMAWHPAFALDNKNVDLDSADTMNVINPSGANMLDNDVIADTGTPPA